MTSSTTTRTLARLALALAAFGSAWNPALAGPLRATSSLTTDPAGVVNVTAASGSAFAAYPSAAAPVATATATRRHLIVDTRAAGHSASLADKYSGSADARTSYVLWNLAEDRALTEDEAAPLRLSFNFNLSGHTSTSGDSHERAVGFSGGLNYSAFPFAVAFGDNASVTVDPNGRVANGNQALMDAVVDLDYTLQHQGAAQGELGFSLFANTAIGAIAFYDLWLESVTLVEDTFTSSSRLAQFAATSASSSSFSLASGLGVKLLDDLGEILVVVPRGDPGTNGVPAPPSWALVLVALGVLRARSRTAA